jgi:hypothetical protein
VKVKLRLPLHFRKERHDERCEEFPASMEVK